MTDFALKPTMPAQKHDDKGMAFWPTPRAPIRAVLAEHPPPKGLRLVEPSAGAGPIAEELVALNSGHLVTAIEIRQECLEPLQTILPEADGHRVVIGDWLHWKTGLWVPWGTCGNPPYDPASECRRHVAHMLGYRPVWAAWLLPLAFACAKERAQLLDEFPPAFVRPLIPRPKFAPEGGGMRDVAWHIWIQGNTSATFKPLWWRKYER